MKLIHKILITGLVAGISISVPPFSRQSNAKNVLTLDKCIELALSNNESVLVAEQKLIEAQGKKREAFGHFLPALSLSGSYTRMSEAPGFSMGMPVPHEMPVSFTDIAGQTFQGFAIEEFAKSKLRMSEENSYLGKVTLNQPLWTWGKIFRGYNLARLNYEACENEYRQVRSQVVYDVRKIFYSVLLAERMDNITGDALTVARDHLNVIREFYEAGKVSSIDVSRVEVQVANAQTRKIRAANGLAIARKALYNLIGVDETDDLEIDGDFHFVPVITDPGQYYEVALEKRPEVQQLKIREKMARTSLGLVRAENRPNLALIANYQYQKPYNFANAWGDSWNATVAMSYTFFSGFSNWGKAKQARAQIEQVEITTRQLKKGLWLEIEKACLDMDEAAKRIEVQKENIKTARENLSAIRARYKKGLVSELDLRDTELALTQTEVEYYQALYDYNVACAVLEKAIGTEVVGSSATGGQ
jgi:outer membrane protein TolC